MNKKITWLSLLISSFILASCGQKVVEENNEKIQIVATFYPMYEFTKAIVGEAGDVSLLIPAGTEPHDYEPSAKDVAKMHDADVVVYNSHVFETWMGNLESNLDLQKTKIIEASQEVELLPIAEADHDHGEEEHDHSEDPHVWLDPILAIKQVQWIQESLSQQFPEKAAYFIKQSEAYIKELRAIDEAYQEALTGAENRSFVTQHGAFSYLAKRYDLTQEVIAGISSEEEPTPARLAKLKTFVQENQIKVIYFEENASAKIAQTLAKETGIELSVLSTIESLTKEQQAASKNYLSIMLDNLEALKLSIR